jgi:hypothetical protein
MNSESNVRSSCDSHRLTVCLIPMCSRLFAVCGRCDRGRHYCSAECASHARRSRQRGASQRYQRTDRGRCAHAARQARYRARMRGVTHQTPLTDVVEVATHTSERQDGSQAGAAQPHSLAAGTLPTRDAGAAAPATNLVLGGTAAPRSSPQDCALCGRVARFLRTNFRMPARTSRWRSRRRHDVLRARTF